jgi:hypothetical protein
MKTWDVYLAHTATEYVGNIEAATEDEAISRACAMSQARLCHNCSDHLDLGDVDFDNSVAEER